MVAWRRRHLPRLWMKEAHGWSVDLAPWDAWSMRCRKECWLPLSPPWTFDSPWPNLLLGLVKPKFINSTTHCLAYYSRKQGLNNGPMLFLFDTPLKIFTSSLAHVKSVRSPCGFGPSWMKLNWIFLSILLIIEPLDGLGLEGACGPCIGPWAWFGPRRCPKL